MADVPKIILYDEIEKPLLILIDKKIIEICPKIISVLSHVLPRSWGDNPFENSAKKAVNS